MDRNASNRSNELVCVVTGASEGIGKVIALRLLSQGFTVILVSRSLTKLTHALEGCLGPGNAHIEVADVSEPEQVNRLFKRLIEKHGHIDVLINNVGQGIKKSLTETSDEEWEFLVKINLSSTIYCCRAVLPGMRSQRKGKIINIASKAGRIGEAEFPAYCAVKHGVVGLTKALAESEKNYGIQVNVVCPGPTATEKMIALYPQADRAHWCSTVEVAEAVLYLVTNMGFAMQGKSLDLF